MWFLFCDEASCQEVLLYMSYEPACESDEDTPGESRAEQLNKGFLREISEWVEEDPPFKSIYDVDLGRPHCALRRTRRTNQLEISHEAAHTNLEMNISWPVQICESCCIQSLGFLVALHKRGAVQSL